eukprot:2076199-Amphidinium_carterae.1
MPSRATKPKSNAVQSTMQKSHDKESNQTKNPMPSKAKKQNLSTEAKRKAIPYHLRHPNPKSSPIQSNKKNTCHLSKAAFQNPMPSQAHKDTSPMPSKASKPQSDAI